MVSSRGKDLRVQDCAVTVKAFNAEVLNYLGNCQKNGKVFIRLADV